MGRWSEVDLARQDMDYCEKSSRWKSNGKYAEDPANSGSTKSRSRKKTQSDSHGYSYMPSDSDSSDSSYDYDD